MTEIFPRKKICSHPKRETKILFIPLNNSKSSKKKKYDLLLLLEGRFISSNAVPQTNNDLFLAKQITRNRQIMVL